MKHLSYSLIGGIGLLSLQSCASKQQVAEQEYPIAMLRYWTGNT